MKHLIVIAFIGMNVVSTLNKNVPPEVRRRITYISLGGNCPGHFLEQNPISAFEICEGRCSKTTECAGFSYSHERDICFIKKKSCPEPIMIGTEFTFYQKFDPTNPTIPGVVPNAMAEDPESLFMSPARKFLDRKYETFEKADKVEQENFSATYWKQAQGSPDIMAVSHFYNPLTMMRQALISTPEPKTDCSKYAGNPNEYILMFMYNQPDQPQVFDLEIYVSSEPTAGNVATEVEISMPRYSAFKAVKGSVSPGQTTMFKLPQTVRMVQSGIDSRAIRVKSSNPTAKISVYGMSRETYTSDGFLVFPTSQLGIDHYLLTWQPSTRGSEFGMAAAYDNTVVQITLPAKPPAGSEAPLIMFNGQTYTNGDTIKITLQADDSFLAINENLNSDLTGTRVISDKPLAVFTGDKRTAIKYISGSPPTRDHLVEQLPAIHTWGTEFVFCTSPNRTDGDYMKIVASQDSTQVLIYGGASGAQQQTIAFAGSFVLSETAPQECLYISSTKPVMVGKFVVSQKPDQTVERTDPAAVIVPPTTSYHSGYSFMTPKYAGLTAGESFEHFILIGVKKENRDGFIVDGAAASLLQVVPTYNDYVCGYLKVPAGSHSIQHSKADVKFLAILYGAADRESYAFVLGQTLKSLCTNNGQPCSKPGILLGNCPYCQEANLVQGCYGNSLQMSCPTGRVVKVISAHYGWYPGICGGSSCGPILNPGNCGTYNVYDSIARFCNGQAKCTFPVASNALFTNFNLAYTMCPLCSTRVRAHFICIPETSLSCSNLVGRTPLFVRYTASSFWRREPGLSPVTCPDDISILSPVDAAAIPAYLPEFARYAAPHGLLWCPSQCDTNSSYIQVDLGRIMPISGYAIQGRLGYDQWVSSVAVDYSSDGRTWSTVSNGQQTSSLGMTGSNNAVFEANKNAERVVVCDLSSFQIKARYFRVWVRAYNGYPCMRLDVFTCGNNAQQNSSTVSPPTGFPIYRPVTVPVTNGPAGPSTQPSGQSTTAGGNSSTPAVTTSGVTNGGSPKTTVTTNGSQGTTIAGTNQTAQATTQASQTTTTAGTVGGQTTVATTTASSIPPSAGRRSFVVNSDGYNEHFRRRFLAKRDAPVPPSCPPLVISNSDMVGRPDQRGAIGQRVTVSCLASWMLPDYSTQFIAICDSTGKWVGINYQCTEPRNCGPIPDIDQSTRVITSGNGNTVGSAITYTCNPGYRLAGNAVVTCQSSTLWTSVPHCVLNV